MKYLVATKETQGEREGDFSFVPEGEQVHRAFVCDRSRRNPDDECGCGRAWGGVDSCMGTTTARVAEGRVEDVLAGLRRAYINEGWYKPGMPALQLDDDGKVVVDGMAYDDRSLEQRIMEEALDDDRVLQEFAVGDIVQCRLEVVTCRKPAAVPS